MAHIELENWVTKPWDPDGYANFTALLKTLVDSKPPNRPKCPNKLLGKAASEYTTRFYDPLMGGPSDYRIAVNFIKNASNFAPFDIPTLRWLRKVLIVGACRFENAHRKFVKVDPVKLIWSTMQMWEKNIVSTALPTNSSVPNFPSVGIILPPTASSAPDLPHL
jgi:hypothetical protein